MGRLSLPDAVRSGRNRCTLELDADELSTTLTLLTQALAAAQSGAAPAPAPGLAAVASSVQSLRVSAPPAAAAPQPAQQTQTQQQTQQQSSTARASAAPTSLASLAMTWSCTWSSPAAEHQHAPISAMTWQQSVDGLAGGGDAHAGWLFSASRGCLNLWECSPSGGVGGEPALNLMHSQAIALRPTCLDVDSASDLLLAAAADARGGAEPAGVSLHTLRPNDFMSMVGGLKPPKPLGGGKAHTQGAPALVVSLSPCGGPLAGCAALAFGKDVSVAALPRGSGAAGAAAANKAHWRALPQGGNVHISAMAAWPAAPLLITGGSDGSLSVWDLRVRPAGAAVAPAASVPRAGGGAVVCVAAPATTLSLSVTQSGEASLWDLRKAGSAMSMQLASSNALSPPAGNRVFCGAVAAQTGDALALMACAPDGKASSLHAALLAPSACGGIGAWSKLSLGGAAKAREAGHAAGSPLCWGRYGGILYAGGADGVVSVYRS